METPLRLTFHGGETSEALSTLIREHVEELERLYGRLTSCNIVVQVPDRHHRVALYAVNLHIVMPGSIDINIDHIPQNDDRFAIPQFAVTDAFRRAKRAIKERAQKLRGDVKTLRERIERTVDQPEG
ncbi:Sigma 54 modulation protein / S30EA ribosomal protein [Enhydrobacter aerosaccus]|uniref:Sigma 54 modulation protein / S30EA ribosomal protein n=1 Tax=Enhydrobacter aerosaccus TaxID=225324 RepID=A0A1T4N8M8_9HYPH|nr:HPF/RaiA family ribosome-associated protein [Enhydrobacter aerosaccus]SJZ75466.1 Sigma 54 modulation protein / S30EA ribosomal protein [Enhydrobacter aerosaccus]